VTIFNIHSLFPPPTPPLVLLVYFLPVYIWLLKHLLQVNEVIYFFSFLCVWLISFSMMSSKLWCCGKGRSPFKRLGVIPLSTCSEYPHPLVCRHLGCCEYSVVDVGCRCLCEAVVSFSLGCWFIWEFYFKCPKLKCLGSEMFWSFKKFWSICIHYKICSGWDLSWNTKLTYVSYRFCTHPLKVSLYNVFSVPAFSLWSDMEFSTCGNMSALRVSGFGALQTHKLGMLNLYF
jgi:hypothetical protein